MPTFRLLTESDVKSVLTMDDLIETMSSALQRFSTGRVEQPIRTVISVSGNHAFFGTMPAFAREPEALGAKLVTVFGANLAKGLTSHLASIVLLDPETGALRSLMDGRYITEARTAAVSAVSSRLLARKTAASLAIIGSGVQARSHFEALSRVHTLRQVTIWSPNKTHREHLAAELGTRGPTGTGPGPDRDRTRTGLGPDQDRTRTGLGPDQDRTRTGPGPDQDRTGTGLGPDQDRTRTGPGPDQDRTRTGVGSELFVKAVDHAGEAVVGADIVVLVTSSPTPVIESGWVKPGAHVISVGASRPNQREMDPALTARGRLFVDSRAAAVVESGDVVMGIAEGRFTADHIVAELGEVVNGAAGRRSDTEVTIFKSLGMAVEDVTAADLAYRRAVEKGIGKELTL
jgi:ornithine cyclodeaminase/alanine dehydrogenase-like protein (mu-crystallin family)